MNKYEKAICKVLIEARKNRSMSQKMLAEKMGISAQQLSKYERGVNRISVLTFCCLADAIGLEAYEFLGVLSNEIKNDKTN